MDLLLQALADWGPASIIIAILMWQNNRIVNRLFNVIENNTAVLTELKTIIDNRVERRHND